MTKEAEKEHRKVEESEAKTALLRTQNESLLAGVQKASPRLQLSRALPQMVKNTD